MIQTVLGPIQKDQLNKTYIHEHLYFDLTNVRNDDDSVQRDIDLTIKELEPALDWGIKSVIDVTCINMGRDVKQLMDLSKKANIHVVCSTGYYLTDYYPEYVFNESVQQLADRMIKECLEGIDGTAIKAGIIGEIGTLTNEFTETNKKVFEAAALTHKATGLAISTHPNMSTMAYEQAVFLIDHGVKADKIIIGHMDLTDDLSYLEKVLDTGVNVGFDTIGKNNYLSEDKRLETLSALIKRGYVNQIVLSEDISRKSYYKSFGGLGYGYLVNQYLPKLKQLGVTDQQIDQMLIENPKNILDRS